MTKNVTINDYVNQEGLVPVIYKKSAVIDNCYHQFLQSAENIL